MRSASLGSDSAEDKIARGAASRSLVRFMALKRVRLGWASADQRLHCKYACKILHSVSWVWQPCAVKALVCAYQCLVGSRACFAVI